MYSTIFYKKSVFRKIVTIHPSASDNHCYNVFIGEFEMEGENKMRRPTASFEELISENIKDILKDPEALAKIEKRLDERSTKRNEQKRKHA